MKLRKSFMAVTFALILGQSVWAADNRKLADVMLMLVDQVAGIGALAKQEPALVEQDSFDRVMARARGAVFLLDMVNEKKGKVENGQFVSNVLSPGVFSTLSGPALESAISQFEAAISAVQNHLSTIENELNTQSQTEPSQRNFRGLKLAMVRLDQAIKRAHENFKP